MHKPPGAHVREINRPDQDRLRGRTARMHDSGGDQFAGDPDGIIPRLAKVLDLAEWRPDDGEGFAAAPTSRDTEGGEQLGSLLRLPRRPRTSEAPRASQKNSRSAPLVERVGKARHGLGLLTCLAAMDD